MRQTDHEERADEALYRGSDAGSECDPANAEAIETCQNLDDVLSKVNEALRTYDE